jgi:hypothetical protein
MAMRVESSVTSLSWIPSEAVTGQMRISFVSRLSHYDPPPPGQLHDLNRMREDDACRFANVLHAWPEFDGNRIAASGQDGGLRMGSTTVQIGPLDASFAGVAMPDLVPPPEIGDGWPRFTQTTGGPFPRQWVRDDTGALTLKDGALYLVLDEVLSVTVNGVQLGVVLTHLHWDHVHGLPFCLSIDHPDASVTLHVPVDSSHTGPHGLHCRWRFNPLLIGEFDTGPAPSWRWPRSNTKTRRWTSPTDVVSANSCSPTTPPHAPGAIRTPRPDDPRRSGRHSNGTQTCITRRGNPEDTMNRNTSPQDSPPHASLIQHRAALIGPTPVPVKGFDNGEGLDDGDV